VLGSGRELVILGGFDGVRRMGGKEAAVINFDTFVWRRGEGGSEGGGAPTADEGGAGDHGGGAACGALGLGFSPRQRHSATLLPSLNRLVVVGGFNGEQWLSDMVVLDVGALRGGGGQDTGMAQSTRTLIQDLGWLLGNAGSSSFSDCTVMCAGNVSVPAHRAILSARVPFFRTLWGFGEKAAAALAGGGGAASHGPEVVRALEEFSRQSVEGFLAWVYTGRFEVPPQYCAAVEALVLGDYVGDEAYKGAAEEALLPYLDADSAKDMGQIAGRHRAQKLLGLALQMMQQ